MYLDIVFGAGASTIFMAIRRSWIFSGESVEFSLWMRLISAMVSRDIFGLPPLDLCFQ
jgi:hypothetical protein